MKNIFITGTDTNIGKTFVSRLLLDAFNYHGLETFGTKPLASGCEYNHAKQLRNKDALQLQATASIKKPYAIVNPIALEAPIAPHLAAEQMGVKLSKSMLKKAILSSVQPNADITLIEGVGSWAAPINEETLFSEVIAALNIPVILVVGIKLGCLNHALLTYKNIISMKVPFIGWVANCLAPEALCIEENIKTLQQWINAPSIGVVPYQYKTNEMPN